MSSQQLCSLASINSIARVIMTIVWATLSLTSDCVLLGSSKLDFASNTVRLHFWIVVVASELVCFGSNGWLECSKGGGRYKGSYLSVCINALL